MRGLVFAALLLVPLGGCATVQPQAADAQCRHVLSAQGRPLRFCETNDTLTVDNRAPEPPPPAEARLIDDPKFLAAMIAHLPARENGAAAPSSRRTTGFRRAPPGYITISDADFLALVRAGAAHRNAAGEALPANAVSNGS